MPRAGAPLSTVLALTVALTLGAAAPAAARHKQQPAADPPLVEAPLGVSLFEPVGPAQVARMANGGVSYARFPLQWNFVEIVPGTYDFSYYDGFVLAAARARIDVLPVLVGTPKFIPHRDAAYPTAPAHLKSFAAFSRAAVQRYGPSGTLWKEHSGLTNPIKTWQIWNEPNLRIYAPEAKPSPTSYRSLLFHGYNAIKAVDPSSEILAAAMAPASPVSDRLFLRQLINSKGVPSHLDSLAVHPYARTPDQSLKILRRFMRDLRSADIEDRGIWVSEIGWSSRGPASAFQTKDPAGQAAALRGVVKQFRDRRKIALRGITWFSWRDHEPTITQPTLTRPQINDWTPYAGLFTFHGFPKPAWTTFTKLAGGQPGTGPLPKETYPQVYGPAS